MSNPESLPASSDPSSELGPVSMPCLRDQLAEIKARFNGDDSSNSSDSVIDLMTTADVEVDDAAGEKVFSCYRSDCMAHCVVAMCLDKPFSVRDTEQLQQCAKNTTDYSKEPHPRH